MALVNAARLTSKQTGFGALRASASVGSDLSHLSFLFITTSSLNFNFNFRDHKSMYYFALTLLSPPTNPVSGSLWD